MVALFREIERGFEAGGGFFELHGGGIDGGDEEFPVECVACADDVDVFAFSDEGFLHPLLAEIAEIAILPHLFAHLFELQFFLLLRGLFGQFFGRRDQGLARARKNSRPYGGRTINSEGNPAPRSRASAPPDVFNVGMHDQTSVLFFCFEVSCQATNSVSVFRTISLTQRHARVVPMTSFFFPVCIQINFDELI